MARRFKPNLRRRRRGIYRNQDALSDRKGRRFIIEVRLDGLEPEDVVTSRVEDGEATVNIRVDEYGNASTGPDPKVN